MYRHVSWWFVVSGHPCVFKRIPKERETSSSTLSADATGDTGSDTASAVVPDGPAAARKNLSSA